ncbi:MAG: M23 family metallopeptidase [Actinomycetota bacterium]
MFGSIGIHAGTDVATTCGTTVRAAAAGVVVHTGIGYQGRTGNQVVILHDNGVLTRYGHLLSGTTLVGIGDRVGAGQPIAGVGGDPDLDPLGAGNSTGCHLHFEVNLRKGAQPIDAVPWLAARGVRLGVDEPLRVVLAAFTVDLLPAAPASAEPATAETPTETITETTTAPTSSAPEPTDPMAPRFGRHPGFWLRAV